MNAQKPNPVKKTLGEIKLVTTVSSSPSLALIRKTLFFDLCTLKRMILSVFFRRIPIDIEEAATVDGAGRMQIFMKITLPLSAASMVATGLFAFMLSYSEFLYSLILGGTQKTRTLSVAMAALSTNTDVAWGMLMAGIFITLIPSLILAILVWKFVVEGIILGAVKY